MGFGLVALGEDVLNRREEQNAGDDANRHVLDVGRCISEEPGSEEGAGEDGGYHRGRHEAPGAERDAGLAQAGRDGEAAGDVGDRLAGGDKEAEGRADRRAGTGDQAVADKVGRDRRKDQPGGALAGEDTLALKDGDEVSEADRCTRADEKADDDLLDGELAEDAGEEIDADERDGDAGGRVQRRSGDPSGRSDAFCQRRSDGIADEREEGVEQD